MGGAGSAQIVPTTSRPFAQGDIKVAQGDMDSVLLGRSTACLERVLTMYADIATPETVVVQSIPQSGGTPLH